MSDDDLKAYDLSTWEAPPAPATLADGVIARMTAADAAIAVAMQRRGKRRWWIAGGVAASVAVASLGLWLALRTPSAASTTGALVAQKPQHVELGATSVNVDAGADLTWWRTGTTLHVEQHRGASTWLVGGADHLVIDAPNVATIDATGASLRVEVSMNMTDVRVIGASAATAAAVALVTVVVYEGHVKATSGGQTMVVMPGSTVEAKPGQPLREALNVGAALPLPTVADAELALPVGESATIHDPRGKTAIQFLSRCKEHTDLQLEPHPTAGTTGAITLSAGTYRYTLRCDGNSIPSAQATVTIIQDAGTAALAPADSTHVASIDLPVDGAAWPDPVHVVGDSTSDATVTIGGRAVIVDSATHFAADLADHPSTIAIRVDDEKRGIHYYIRRAGTAKDVTVATHTDPLPKQTDFDFTNDAPDRASIDKVIASAQHAIDACAVNTEGGDVKIKLTIAGNGHAAVVVSSAPAPELGACVGAALQRLTFAKSKHGATITKTLAFPVKQALAACDPQPLIEAGTNSEAMGAHAQALKQFEDALKCKQDTRTLQLAFMAACNAANLPKAKMHWAKMSPDMQDRNVQICARSHISRDQLDGGLTTHADQCDPEPLVEAGTNSEAMGNHAQALKQFEDALKCKSDTRSLQLAFMASCNANNVAKAKLYWGKMKPDQRERLLQLCMRMHITRDQLDSP